MSVDMESSYSGRSHCISTVLNSSRSTSSTSSGYSQDSNISDFYGGRRLEGLLQALNSERQSGDFLRKYLQRSNSEVSDQ